MNIKYYTKATISEGPSDDANTNVPPKRTGFFLFPQGVQCGDAGSGRVTAGGLSCSLTAIQRCSWSAPGIEISRRPPGPPPAPLDAFSQAPTPPPRVTWDA